VLQNTKLWDEVDAQPIELDMQLRERYLLPTLKSGFSRDVAESLIDMLSLWWRDSENYMMAQKGVDMLERILLWTSGVSPEEIERFNRRVTSNEMAERYRQPWSSAERHMGSQRNTHNTQRNTYERNRKNDGRIPRHIWAKLSPEARREINASRRQ
jgi:hypothetical protein